VAIYHLSAKTVSRAEGRSSVAAAAYRAGERLVDERTGEIHDFTRKGGVVAGNIVLPGGGTMPRSQLWNAVEQKHKRGDSLVAREFEVALPHEMTDAQRLGLVAEYCRELADGYGVAIDYNLHRPGDGSLNEHAHIQMSACYCSPDGVMGKKAVELDPIHCARAKILNPMETQRERWQDLCNSALERAGSAERIDHRTLEAQGITDRQPGVHLGTAVNGILGRNEQSHVADRARAAADAYIAQVTADAAIRQAAERDIEELEKEISRLKNELKMEDENDRIRAEAFGKIDSALRASSLDITATNRNLGRAIQGAERLQHRRHVGKIVEAVGRFLGSAGERLEKVIGSLPKTPKTLDEIWALQQQADTDRKAARKEFDQVKKDADYWPSIQSKRAITQAQHDQWKAKQRVLAGELQAATKQVQSLEKRIEELPWYKFKTELINQLESFKQKESTLQKAEHEARSIITVLPIKEHVEAQEKEAAERRAKGQAALAAAQEKLARAEELYRELDQARMDQIDLERAHTPEKDSIATHRQGHP
jgi:hypothetical protein